MTRWFYSDSLESMGLRACYKSASIDIVDFWEKKYTSNNLEFIVIRGGIKFLSHMH